MRQKRLGASHQQSLGRRFLASAVGLATLVSDRSSHEEGRFLRVPSDILETVMSSSAATHVYFREILMPAWAEIGDENAIVSMLDPDNIYEHMKSSTDWYVARVSGLGVEPRPSCICSNAGTGTQEFVNGYG